ncbi:YiiX/YebB-like N1pC/P60 family cysteine hydrolase [Fructobacillus durionis]|uniref:Permuted papain-like amidase enzyme, YaeF/YiiX, C92 family n=1 Tax=Fructobacillus durionis TaxID=283737 RepID=A0A1I1FFS3_9LACO|nr:YiiX/YebB-like N1pC/P60 family cysteine hydrolase [Fructobacillus durionis]SFB96548.1 Permuted papain-like amidase enzyme, YaeF/YiiX, C92 family [Fructobacillus durionis]
MTELQNADLAFVLPKKEQLDQAISDSTLSDSDSSYVHVALIEKTKENHFFIIESTGKRGVIRRPLQDFINEHQNHLHFYRTINPLKDVKNIIQRAKAHLGEPYNHGFFQEGPGYYCSQLVIEAYKDENIFCETPLSFGPNGTILLHWVQYYQELGKKVPINQVGSSPNSLIASHQLQKIQ